MHRDVNTPFDISPIILPAHLRRAIGPTRLLRYRALQTYGLHHAISLSLN
ncbi:MAG: hypothetical protein II899_05165 [Bacteroidales bacterium]|nr:hypothetical protein [Bacteroidales bacterium]